MVMLGGLGRQMRVMKGGRGDGCTQVGYLTGGSDQATCRLV